MTKLIKFKSEKGNEFVLELTNFYMFKCEDNHLANQAKPTPLIMFGNGGHKFSFAFSTEHERDSKFEELEILLGLKENPIPCQPNYPNYLMRDAYEVRGPMGDVVACSPDRSKKY